MTRTFSPVAMGYSILAGPVCWFIHFIGVYVLVEFGCRANFTNQLFITPQNIRLIILLATLPALIAVGWGGMMAYRMGQSLERDEQSGELAADKDAPSRFLVTLAMVFSVFFAISIVFTVMPTFFLSVCDKAI